MSKRKWLNLAKKWTPSLIFIAFALLAWLWMDKDTRQIFLIAVFSIPIMAILRRNMEKSEWMTVIGVLGSPLLSILTDLPRTAFGQKVDAFWTAVFTWLTLEPLDAKSHMLLYFLSIFLMPELIKFIWDKFSDFTAVGRILDSKGKNFGDAEYQERLKSFQAVLRNRLNSAEQDARWDALGNFVPVSAIVEMSAPDSMDKRRWRYENLLDCLRKGRRQFGPNPVYLVLGDPGAGKSVSLRKLCVELLDEAEESGKTPVYVNLKQWDVSPENMTKKNLTEFVQSRLYENGDFATDAFLDEYFQKMLDNQRWYFVFDSFDELPCLLSGGSESEEAIKQASRVLHEFLTETAQNGGVIASRLYHKPNSALKSTVTLRLEEFDNGRVRTMIQRYLPHSNQMQEALFRERNDLVALCRNPFYLSLMIAYAKDNNHGFPANQMELYDAFLNERLNSCEKRLQELNMSREALRWAAVTLADRMQVAPEYGLEYPTEKLYEDSASFIDWRKITDLLQYARLCRISQGEQRISFAHRRFQEFFLVDGWRARSKAPTVDDYACILRNTGLRDALALYCEVTDLEKASEIARYCWGTVKRGIPYRKDLQHQESVEMVHALYFMADAFRLRREAIVPFAAEYETLIRENLRPNTHYVVNQALTRGMSLFETEHLPEVALHVFTMGNRWLNDAIIQDCAAIKKLNEELELRFCEHYLSLNCMDFLQRYRNDHFSLSLEKCFRFVSVFHGLLFLRIICFPILLFFSVVSWIMAISGNSIVDVSATGSANPVFLVFALTLALCAMATIEYKRSFENLGITIFSGVFALFFSSTAGRFLSAITPVIYVIPLILLSSVDIALVIKDGVYRHHIRKMQPKRGILDVIVGILHEVKSFICMLILSIPVLLLLSVPFELYEQALELAPENMMLAILMMLPIGLLGLAVGGVFLLVCVALLLMVISSFWYFLTEPLKIRKWDDVSVLERAKLTENLLENLHSNRGRRIYVTRLVRQDVRLSGKWPDDSPPSFKDDALNRDIARLDCTDIENMDYHF